MTLSSGPIGAREIVSLAGLLADGTRASFCLALLDGRAWTAGELARFAGVAPSTATAHITLLVDGGLLVDERQGRHRYVRLAGWQAAQIVEDMASHSPLTTMPPQSLRTATVAASMAQARTCYDHLAGRLGVLLTDTLTRSGLLDQSTGFAFTSEGIEWLNRTLGINVRAYPTRRPLTRSCMDWTERRPHLAGLAGALLCDEFFVQQWAIRIGSHRAVRVTSAGETALQSIFGVDADEVAALHA